MSDPTSRAIESPRKSQHPALRVAAGFCMLDGLLGLLGAFQDARGIHPPWMTLGVGVVVASLMIAAAILLWKRRQVGAVLILLAYALYAGNGFFTDGSFRGPSLLMVLAMLVLALNGRKLGERSPPVN